MQRLYSSAVNIVTTGLPTDELEHELVAQFMTSGCGCTKARGTQCCNQFTREYVTSARETCAELTHSELDMAILGQLAAGTNTSSSLSTGMLSITTLPKDIGRKSSQLSPGLTGWNGNVGPALCP